jgi:hypothetical protein
MQIHHNTIEIERWLDWNQQDFRIEQIEFSYAFLKEIVAKLQEILIIFTLLLSYKSTVGKW